MSGAFEPTKWEWEELMGIEARGSTAEFYRASLRIVANRLRNSVSPKSAPNAILKAVSEVCDWTGHEENAIRAIAELLDSSNTKET